MNELLQKHGCSNVFTIPEGLRELMADISREVLREQPVRIYEFISNYLAVLLVTREHGILAIKILEDLCDCRPTVSEHLMQLGMVKKEAQVIAKVIKEEVTSVQYDSGKETVREAEILQKILKKISLDEEMTSKVCEIARNAFKDYWYRKSVMEQSLKDAPGQTWEIAVQRTLNLYKTTRPTTSELTRAATRIQAAYRGYYVRKKMLKHLKPKKKQAPKVNLQGPPADIAESREIDVGKVVDIKVNLDDVNKIFIEENKKNLELHYDPMKPITHSTEEVDEPALLQARQRQQSRMMSSKNMTTQIFGSKSKGKSTEADPARTSIIASHKTSSENSEWQAAEGPRKISFGGKMAKVSDSTEDDLPENLAPKGTKIDNKDEEILEDLQDIPQEPIDDLEDLQDTPQEPIDDLGDLQDGPQESIDDSESAPVTSMISSGPATAPSTDVEDLAEEVNFNDV